MMSFATGCSDILEARGGAPLSGVVLMLSAPTAIPTSIEPANIWFAMVCTANKPEEHHRLTVETAVVTGKPAAMAAPLDT